MRYHNIIRLIYTGFFFLLAGSIASAQNNNISSGTFTVAGVPGAANQGTQQQQDPEEEIIMSTKPSFSISRYFKALGHRDSMNISHMFAGSVLLPGTAQIYNRQTWKLPILYGTLGGFIGGAVACNVSYQSSGKASTKNWRNAMIAGAALTYYGSLLDGVISYKSYRHPLPARASLYSALLPGLGQAYNGDYWKIPIFYGGFVVSGYCWAFNQKQYKRYKNMYIEAAAEGSNYQGNLSLDNMIWYRDKFRRFRDYSIIATALIYVLNIIDANVFAHFNNFDISDDISFKVEPGVIEPVAPTPAMNSYYGQTLGLKMNLNF